MPIGGFALFVLGSHGGIEKNSLALIAHHQNVVAEGVDGPVRIHLHHGQEVIYNHAVAHVDGVDVATFLEHEGHISPVRVEHDVHDGASDHVARLGRRLQIRILPDGAARRTFHLFFGKRKVDIDGVRQLDSVF